MCSLKQDQWDFYFINKTFVTKEIGLVYVLETFKMYASL